ncbi:sodium/solute symporter [Methanococcoides burtonii DSM 6242]|uniref:Sodium/solute symporter n=1 Tax=Methanococcoides burtonii (strain DSM 6242 / NBRC 107633 / OCM 468 / ACE-M) TaxID=259564 RepID=Q12YS8_METBU|nr:sodium/solute symporter [Methanococcoides burtonii DSM 6242]
MAVNTSTLGIFVLVYLLAVFYCGWLAYKRTKDVEDYMLAGRKVNPYILALSYGAAFISTAAIIGFGGVTGTLGLGTLWLVFMNIFVGIFIAFVVFGARTRRIGLNLGAVTFPELIGRRFQSRFIQGYSGALIALFMPLYAGIVLIGGARFMETALCMSNIAFAGTTDTALNIEDGTKIASFYTMELANTFPELACWEGSSVEHETTYYNFNGDITAYTFNVVKNDRYQEYILVSATKDNYPILEFSKGKLPHMDSDIKDGTQSLVTDYASENRLSIEKSTPIYAGATFYYDKYEMVDSRDKSEKTILVDRFSKNVIDITNAKPLDNVEKNTILENEDIQEAWTNLEYSMTDTKYSASPIATRSSLGYIFDVPLKHGT